MEAKLDLILTALAEQRTELTALRTGQDEVGGRLSVLENVVGRMYSEMNQRFDGVNARLDSIDRRIDHLDSDVHALVKRHFEDEGA